MAKNIYMGIGGTARKIKGMYIGVGGVARKVVKAYIGVNGVARQFWPSIATIKFNNSFIFQENTPTYTAIGNTQGKALWSLRPSAQAGSVSYRYCDNSLTQGTGTYTTTSYSRYSTWGDSSQVSENFGYCYVFRFNQNPSSYAYNGVEITMFNGTTASTWTNGSYAYEAAKYNWGPFGRGNVAPNGVCNSTILITSQDYGGSGIRYAFFKNNPTTMSLLSSQTIGYNGVNEYCAASKNMSYIVTNWNLSDYDTHCNYCSYNNSGTYSARTETNFITKTRVSTANRVLGAASLNKYAVFFTYYKKEAVFIDDYGTETPVAFGRVLFGSSAIGKDDTILYRYNSTTWNAIQADTITIDISQTITQNAIVSGYDPPSYEENRNNKYIFIGCYDIDEDSSAYGIVPLQFT